MKVYFAFFTCVHMLYDPVRHTFFFYPTHSLLSLYSWFTILLFVLASGNFIRISFIFDVVSTFCTIILSTVCCRVDASQHFFFLLFLVVHSVKCVNGFRTFIQNVFHWVWWASEKRKSSKQARERQCKVTHIHIYTLFIYICALCISRIMSTQRRNTVLLYA